MPKDTLEQRLEAAKAQAIEEQARLQQEERASGQKWKIAPLEDRIELAQRMAKNSWEKDLEFEQTGRQEAITRDPFLREDTPSAKTDHNRDNTLGQDMSNEIRGARPSRDNPHSR